MQGEYFLKFVLVSIFSAGFIMCAIPAAASDDVTTTTTQENTLAVSPTPLAVEVDQGAVAVVKNPDINTGTVTTNINQENNVFLGPKPTPTPTPAPTPKIIVNDFITLQVTDNRDFVRPGETLKYLVIIHNPLPWDIHLDKILVHIPEFVIPRADEVSPGSSQNPANRTVEWHDRIVSAEGEITFSVAVKIDDFAPAELTLITEAEINGDGIRQNASDETSVFRLTAIAGASTEVAVKPVHVTATTGSETFSLLISPFTSLIGAFGLTRFLGKSATKQG